jgi:hypothetical protein
MDYDNVVSYQRGESLSITGFHCVQPSLSDSSNARNRVSSFLFHCAIVACQRTIVDS